MSSLRSKAFLPANADDARLLYAHQSSFPGISTLRSFFDSEAFKNVSTYRPPEVNDFGLHKFPSATYPALLISFHVFKDKEHAGETSFVNALDAYFPVVSVQRIFSEYFKNLETSSPRDIIRELPGLVSDSKVFLVRFFSFIFQCLAFSLILLCFSALSI